MDNRIRSVGEGRTCMQRRGKEDAVENGSNYKRT